MRGPTNLSGQGRWKRLALHAYHPLLAFMWWKISAVWRGRSTRWNTHAPYTHTLIQHEHTLTCAHAPVLSVTVVHNHRDIATQHTHKHTHTCTLSVKEKKKDYTPWTSSVITRIILMRPSSAPSKCLTKAWSVAQLKTQKRHILVQNLDCKRNICTLRAKFWQSQKICDIVGNHHTGCLAAFSLKFILNSIQNLNRSRKFQASLNRKTTPTNLLIKISLSCLYSKHSASVEVSSCSHVLCWISPAVRGEGLKSCQQTLITW